MNIIELSGSQFLAVIEMLGTFAFAVSAWFAAIQILNCPGNTASSVNSPLKELQIRNVSERHCGSL